jgi:signal transduction histidine kinase
VLVVGLDEFRIAERLAALDRFSVSTVSSPRPAHGRPDAGVVCVIAAPTEDAVETVAAAPRIFVGERYDADHAATAAAAGGRYVPLADVSDEAFVDLVRQSARDGERHLDRWSRTSAFEQLLSSHDEMISVKNRAGQYVAVSSYSGGPDPETLHGRTDAELARERDNEWSVLEYDHQLTMDVLKSGDPILGSVEQHGSGEAAFWFERTIRPWNDESGRRRGVLGHVREVSEWERERRRMQRRIDQLERFTDFVSHDLRSPLQIADGYLELAREGDEDALDRVAAANDRMQELIGDFEALVDRPDADDADPHYTRLADLARDVWAVVARESATLHAELPDETVVNAAQSALRPILENLFTNAVDHGGSAPTVWLGALDDGFYVEDDGPGIPADERDRVFEEGFTTSEDGTGTGLAIVSDAVERLKWDIGIEAGRTGGAKIVLRNCLLATDPSRHPLTDVTYDLTDARDVGALHLDGSSRYDPASDQWILTGDGDDIYAENNDFRYVYTTLAGPVSITARLVDLEAVNHYSKAGVMVRDGSDDDATHGYVGRTPGHGVETTWRQERGGRTVSQQLESGAGDAHWLRLDRVGDEVTCYVSRDGEGWRTIDQRTVPLEDRITVGLAVCSVVPRTTSTARFDNVSVRRIRPELE